ncbi:hypothetical protein [Burkholderia sp. Bp8963]|uniref:hypothetical protein n=1 Tax=Burkholderia sp. Bp8963 TaxID=2184547 RepID=UPI000F59ADC1|nr:hypothetical protein [Burkholderia sp. Bp8963]
MGEDRTSCGMHAKGSGNETGQRSKRSGQSPFRHLDLKFSWRPIELLFGAHPAIAYKATRKHTPHIKQLHTHFNFRFQPDLGIRTRVDATAYFRGLNLNNRGLE